MDCVCATWKDNHSSSSDLFAYYLNRLINDVDVNGSEMKDLK